MLYYFFSEFYKYDKLILHLYMKTEKEISKYHQ